MDAFLVELPPILDWKVLCETNRYSRWAVAQEQSSQDHPAPRIQLLQRGQPRMGQIMLCIFQRSKREVVFQLTFPTLLCTSHGFVIAERSHAVIIIALVD